MMRSPARVAPVKKSSRLDSSSCSVGLRNPQRVDDHPLPGLELDEVEAAERGRVLILQSATQTKVHPFDLPGQMGDVVVAEAEPVVVAQQADQADHQCRRGSET